jgi:hypothetical protein
MGERQMLNCKLHWLLAAVMACSSSGCSEGGGGTKRPGLGGLLDAAVPGPDAGGDGDGDAGADGDADTPDAGSEDDAGDAAPPDDLLEPDTVLTKPEVPAVAATVLPGAPTEVPTDCSEDEVPCNGSCLELGQSQDGCRVLLLDSNLAIEALLADAEHLYFGRAQRVERLPLAGGEPELLSDALFNPRLHGVRDGKLLFTARQNFATETRTLHEVPVTGGEVTQLLTGTRVERVALSGERTHYATYESQAQLLNQQVHVQDTPGAPLRRLFSLGQVHALDVEGEWLAAGFRDATDTQGLALTHADGSGSTAMLEDADLRPADVFLEGGHAYWFGENYIGRVAAGASETAAIVRFPFQLPRLMAHDAGHIYLAEETHGVVYQMPLAGGDLTPVATFATGWNPSVQVHDGKLYVAISEGGASSTYDRRAIVEMTLP